jgi:hypothetical protein
MKTYSASRRVNGPGHPLNGRLGGYYQGRVPQVPRAASYRLTNLDMAQFTPAAPDMAPPLMAEGEGLPT